METFEREQPGVAAKGNEHPLMMKPHSQFSLEVDSHPSAPMIIAAQPVQQRWQQQWETAPNTTWAMRMSFCSTICCCLWCGITAIVWTNVALSEIHNGHYSKARKKLKTAWACITLSIMTGSFIIVWYLAYTYKSMEQRHREQDAYEP
ncbi:uncharacterized protein [Littorina saxatilis]|uniref:Uncharacterized protein n=1 Tax=Littorina saxatilis TaxID=31220 RepID=A0AAN9BIA0_9CAEN